MAEAENTENTEAVDAADVAPAVEEKAPAKRTAAKRKPAARIETYTQVRPDGKVAHIERNIDTGDSKVVKVTEG